MQHPKLAWVDLLRQTLGEATGLTVSGQIREHVDPLKKMVELEFSEPLGKGNYGPLQTIVHAFAKANDCVVASIRRDGPQRYVLETLIKNRVSEAKRNNPFRSDKGEPSREG